MKLRTIFIPTVLMCTVALTALAQGTADIAAELAATKQAIQQGDLARAWMRSLTIHGLATAELRHAPVPHQLTETALRSPRTTSYKIAAKDIASLLALADEVGQSLSSGDIRKVYESTRALSTTLAQKYSSLPSSQKLSALEQDSTVAGGIKRFVKLPDMAMEAYESGDLGKASSYANELLVTAARHPDWPQGDAVHYGNVVLGRIAMQHSNLGTARSYLLTAGENSGSPRLNSFGPHMALAADLLAYGDRETVLEYLAKCKSFWKNDMGKLDQWSAAIRQGKTPDFGYTVTH